VAAVAPMTAVAAVMLTKNLRQPRRAMVAVAVDMNLHQKRLRPRRNPLHPLNRSLLQPPLLPRFLNRRLWWWNRSRLPQRIQLLKNRQCS
jgi:hypothetical protein